MLDDLGNLAADMRERRRVRRLEADRAEAESAAWLDRLARVSREDDPRWALEADERRVAQAADDARRATPFGPTSAIYATATTTVEALQRQVLELLQTNEQLTNDLAIARRELVNLRQRNDALVTQLAALRFPQQRPMALGVPEGGARHGAAATPLSRVDGDVRVRSDQHERRSVAVPADAARQVHTRDGQLA